MSSTSTPNQELREKFKKLFNLFINEGWFYCPHCEEILDHLIEEKNILVRTTLTTENFVIFFDEEEELEAEKYLICPNCNKKLKPSRPGAYVLRKLKRGERATCAYLDRLPAEEKHRRRITLNKKIVDLFKEWIRIKKQQEEQEMKELEALSSDYEDYYED